MDTAGRIATFRDYVGFGMVDLCIVGVNCDQSLDWTERHFTQGFAWRDSLVGFRAVEGDGPMEVHLWLTDAAVLRPDTVRAVRVPFTMPPGGRVQIRCGWNRPAFPPGYPIPPGSYALTFATGYDPRLEDEEDREAGFHGFWCDLIFVRDAAAAPAVLVADVGLAPAYPLLMHAD